MANLKEAFDYAAKNPNTPFAKNLEKMASSGALDVEAKKFNIDLTPFKPVVEEKRNIGQKILGFTGGEEIAQGLAQAIVQPKIAKDLENVQQAQSDIQGQLITRIKENKALGKDTSRLEEALGILSQEISRVGQDTEEALNPAGLTNKQVLGDALQLATTVAGAGSYSKAGLAGDKILTTGLQRTTPQIIQGVTQTPGIVSGAIQGAKTGTVAGATLGASTGVSQGLQEDLTTEEIINKGLSGATTGAIAGGLLGGVTGGITGARKVANTTPNQKFLDDITPDTKDLTPTEYEDLLLRGKITPKSRTTPAQYILSDAEKAVAEKYKNIFTQDPVKNTTNIAKEIAKKDKEVGTFLEKNNGIFNTGELKNNLAKKLEDIDDLTIDETRLLKLKESTIDNFIKSLKKNDMTTLWKARKDFDRNIEKAFTGSPTLQNTIKKEFRNAVQDFISERTPEGVYRNSMREMSELFNLKDIVITKAIKEKGLNPVQVWIKRNPTKAKVIGWTAGTGIGATVLGSALTD